MRSVRRMIPFAAAAMLGTLGLLPLAPSAAASTWTTYPADCTETVIDNSSKSLTCTDRPANQTWRLVVLCYGAWVDLEGHGNIVTGNGTSTVVCPYSSRAYLGWFVYD